MMYTFDPHRNYWAEWFANVTFDDRYGNSGTHLPRPVWYLQNYLDIPFTTEEWNSRLHGGFFSKYHLEWNPKLDDREFHKEMSKNFNEDLGKYIAWLNYKEQFNSLLNEDK